MKTSQQEKQRQAGRLPYNCARSNRFAAACVILLFSLAPRSYATTYYVSGGLGSNAYDGLTNIVVSGTDGPKLNVTNAIAAASSGDTLDVADGFYQETNWDLSGKSLTLNPDGLVIVYNSNPASTFTIGDGISDGWRQYYFADPTTTNSDSCASCDPNNEELWNLYAYQYGVDPLDFYSGALQPPACFTNLFLTNTTIIAIQPSTNGCIFYAGESVTITSAAPIEVYQLTYGGQTTSYTSGGASLTFTASQVGHYFVQSGNDRAEFVVLPSDYSTLDNVGHDDDETEVYSDIADRAKLNWVRVIADWGAIQTNQGAAFDWAATGSAGYSVIARLNSNSGKANVIFSLGHADWATNYAFADWLTDFTNFVAAAHAQFGTNSSIVQLDALNEVSDGNVNTAFTGDYSSYAKQVYQGVSVVWPAVPQIGPSESSPGSALPALCEAAGAAAYLDAVDYHDYYNGYGDSTGDPDDPVYGVVAGRAGLNLEELGTTNIFVTELGLLGASSLGYPNDPIYVNYGNCFPSCTSVDSLPPYSWYRGLTRAMRTAVLYAQYRAVVLYHSFATAGGMDVTGIDGNGIKPKTSAFLMTSYWLNGATPVTNWVSGNFHLAESVWSNGMTNTFVWATEGTSVTTNLGVTVTDVWSNQWTGAIGEEPVIAWGWTP